jgi:hypothetical protein
VHGLRRARPDGAGPGPRARRRGGPALPQLPPAPRRPPTRAT